VRKRGPFALDLSSPFVLNNAAARDAIREFPGRPWEAVSVTSVEGDPAAQQASAIGGQSEDRFLWGVPLFALCCEIILVTLTYLERVSGYWLILAAVLLFLVVSVMVVVAGMGIFALVTGRFKRAAALLLAPLIVASPFLFPIWSYQHDAVELLRLYLNKGYYDATIAKLPPAERSTKVIFFDWGSTGFLDAASYYWLVYDEGDEIALPDEERSQAWKDRIYPDHRLVDEHCLTSARRLSGHYYSMVAHCAPG
jgi:hypothetical protein